MAAADASTDENISKRSRFREVCRACTDFKTWAKQRNKNNSDINEKDSSKKATDDIFEESWRRPDCPLDRTELGRNTWSFLHTMAEHYPEKPSKSQQQDMEQFITLFSKFYPCDDCAKDIQKKLPQMPPKTHSQKALSQWFCQLHNSVNVRLGKSEFDCSLVSERWRDGWKDGSCD